MRVYDTASCPAAAAAAAAAAVQVSPPVDYSASLAVAPAFPVVNEPATWTATVTRARPAPSSLTLACGWFAREGPAPPPSDGAYRGLVRNGSTVTLEAGATTVTCTTTAIYTAAGAITGKANSK